MPALSPLAPQRVIASALTRPATRCFAATRMGFADVL